MWARESACANAVAEKPEDMVSKASVMVSRDFIDILLVRCIGAAVLEF